MAAEVADASGAVIALSGIERSFGPVKALRGVDLSIGAGEIVGLVGHNGAGKSTLMNILAGVLSFDAGSYRIGSDTPGRTGARSPAALGIGCVSQELLAAPNLTVAENARIVHRHLTGFGWRRRAGRLMTASLDAIFPGHGIAPDDTIGELTITQRQMVEIARAFAAEDLRLVILDEPTSSLDSTAAEQLLAHIEGRRSRGLAVILISHLLGEILRAATRVVVMRDGRVVRDAPVAGLTRGDLVEAMGHVAALPGDGAGARPQAPPPPTPGEPCIRVPAERSGALAVEARLGEVIGFAGLAGRGQTRFLRLLSRGRGVLPKAGGGRNEISFVAGDRKADGIFPAWSVEENLTIRSMRRLRRFGLISKARERALSQVWRERTGIRAASLDTGIVTLSGGNQQKVLFARALGSDAEVILMDDPMRGVDIGTKTDVYRLIRQEAAGGRCFVWYTTEIDELAYCDRVYVFRDGVPAVELVGSNISEANVVGASFAS